MDDIFAKMDANTDFPVTMQEKVLAYIKEHPMGVNVSEMERLWAQHLWN